MSKMMFLDEFPADVNIEQKIEYFSKVFEVNVGTKAHSVLVNLHQYLDVHYASGLPVFHSSGINGNVFCLVGD